MIDASKKKSASNVTEEDFDFDKGLLEALDGMNNELDETIDNGDFDLPPIELP